ncbi:hypothetical protein GCM10028810_14680 [Spirosoma litoris]
MRVMARVFFTFFGTGFTDFGTQYHKIAGEIGAPGIQTAAQCTDISTIAAEFNASRHVMTFSIFVAHFQASRYAGFGAFETGVYMGMRVLHRFHNRCCRFIDHRWSDKITTHTR